MCKDFGVKQVLGYWRRSSTYWRFSLFPCNYLRQDFLKTFKIGIAGHPDGSPDISDSDLEKAMIDKKPFADYIVTQWLMETSPIIDFISKQSLPVHVGIAGPAKITSLLKFASIVGAKNSLSFLKSNASKAVDLFKPRKAR